MRLKIGHRGAPDYEPENTLGSFKKAISMGVDMIEFDVHRCKSGEVVVIHDNKVNRTTNGKGAVKNKTIQQLKLLDAGNGEKIPTLREVLDLVNKRIKVNIELKGNNTAQPTLEIIREYINKKSWKYSHFLVSSFKKRELKKIYQLDTKIRLGSLSKRGIKDCLRLAKMINAYSIHLHLRQVNKKLIDRVHEGGYKLMIYTIKTKTDIEKIKHFRIDGIFINDPKLR